MIEKVSAITPGRIAATSVPAALFLASLTGDARSESTPPNTINPDSQPANLLQTDNVIPSMEQSLRSLGLTAANLDQTAQWCTQELIDRLAGLGYPFSCPTVGTLDRTPTPTATATPTRTTSLSVGTNFQPWCTQEFIDRLARLGYPFSCGVPNNETPTPTTVPILTATRPPDLTVTRTPTPTATSSGLSSTTFNWDIGPGVPAADIQRIQAGFNWARTEFKNYYGKDILRPANSPITIKIVADGTGDGCCSAFDVTSGDIGPRPRFDVKHPLWLNMSDLDKEIAAAHESTHVFHSTLGCLTLPVHPLPDWLEEGTAAYIPHKSLSRTGILNDQVTKWTHFVAAEDSGQFNVPLQTLEHPAPFYPGHAGYIAADKLVSMASTGHMSLRQICEAVGLDKAKFNQEFQRIFGTSKSDFYNQFPAYLQSLRTSPLYLELKGRLPAGTTPNRVEYEFNFAAHGYEKLTPSQQFAAWALPPEMCGWGQEQLGRVIIALCNASPKTYPIGLQLPDGRSAQVNINHTN